MAIRNKVSSAFRKAAGAAGSTKERIINTTASVISAPARARHKIKGGKTAREAKILKTARAYDRAPSFKDGKPTGALKFRTAAAAIRRKRIIKKK